jgi:hypothetical protein
VSVLTVDEFRAQFALLVDLGDERLFPSLAQASRTVRQMVGADFYNAVEGDTQETERKSALKWAEANFAMYFALPSVSAPVRPNGVVQTETVEESASQKYLDPKSVEVLRRQYWDDALAALDPYTRPSANQTGVQPVTSFVFRKRKC